MKISRFEDLDCWQEARKFVNTIYQIINHNSFKKDFSLSDQIKRASISIMANIAEGFSRKGKKEFVQFLFISKSSAAEVQSHLYVALDLGYVSKNKFNELYNDLDKIQRMISNLIKHLNNLK